MATTMQTLPGELACLPARESSPQPKTSPDQVPTSAPDPKSSRLPAPSQAPPVSSLSRRPSLSLTHMLVDEVADVRVVAAGWRLGAAPRELRRAQQGETGSWCSTQRRQFYSLEPILALTSWTQWDVDYMHRKGLTGICLRSGHWYNGLHRGAQ